MGAAIYPVFESDLPEYDAGAIIGKALSRQLEQLDDIAEQLDVMPLSQMIDGRTMAEMTLGEDDDFVATLPPVQWHPASAGLATLRALLRHLEAHPDAVEDVSATSKDLRDIETVLEIAENRQIRFNLLVDI